MLYITGTEAGAYGVFILWTVSEVTILGLIFEN